MKNLSINFLSKKSSIKEAIILSNIKNYLWFFWSFYLFYLLNIIYNDQFSGSFYIRNSYASIVAIVSTWGISLFGARIISFTYESKINQIKSIYKKLLYLIFTPIIILLPFVMLISFTNFFIFFDTLMLKIFFYLLTHGVFLAISGFYEGLQRFRLSFLFTVAKFLIDIILISFILIFKKIYNIFLICTFIDFIFLVFLILSFNTKIKGIIKEELNNNDSSQVTFLHQIKQEALPIALIIVSGIISENLSRLFIGLTISEKILPTFIFATQVILVISRIGNGFLAGLVPKLTELGLKREEKKSKNLILKSCLINEILMCAAILIIYIFYEPVTCIIFDSNFSETSSEFIYSISISLIFFAFYGIFSSYFISIGKPKYSLISSLTSSFVNILIIISLAPYFGLYAVIIGFVICRGLIFFIIPIIFLLIEGEKKIVLNVFKIFTCSIVFFILISFLQEFFFK